MIAILYMLRYFFSLEFVRTSLLFVLIVLMLLQTGILSVVGLKTAMLVLFAGGVDPSVAAGVAFRSYCRVMRRICYVFCGVLGLEVLLVLCDSFLDFVLFDVVCYIILAGLVIWWVYLMVRCWMDDVGDYDSLLEWRCNVVVAALMDIVAYVVFGAIVIVAALLLFS